MEAFDVNIENLSSIVDKIISYKTSNCDEACVKGKKIEGMIVKGLKPFKYVRSSCKEKSMYWYLLGIMYGCSSKYRQESIDALKTATERDPDFVEAWNCLGESYWMNAEEEEAQKCFERALEKSANKLSLRYLSVLKRQQSGALTGEDKTKQLMAAMGLAKRALDLDPTDGQSWSILGNSYLAALLDCPSESHYSRKAIGSYTQAERNLHSGEKLDVYYNKAVVFKHIENYSAALDYFSKCIEEDKTWTLPLGMYNHLIRYLDLIKSNIGQEKNEGSVERDHEPNPLSPSTQQSVILIRELKEGSNPASVLCGKLMCIIEMNSFFPSTVILGDNNGDQCAVTIFNLNINESFFKVGDSVAIPNPQYAAIEVAHREKRYTFKKIRVDDPSTLIINNNVLPECSYVKYNFVSSVT